MGEIKIVFDITESSTNSASAVGNMLDRPDGEDTILGSREGRHKWFIFGGGADQYRAEGSSPEIALQRFAKAAGYTDGKAEICYEATDGRKVLIGLSSKDTGKVTTLKRGRFTTIDGAVRIHQINQLNGDRTVTARCGETGTQTSVNNMGCLTCPNCYDVVYGSKKS